MPEVVLAIEKVHISPGAINRSNGVKSINDELLTPQVALNIMLPADIVVPAVSTDIILCAAVRVAPLPVALMAV